MTEPAKPKTSKLNIINNSPVTIAFASTCFITLVLGYLTSGWTTSVLFSVYRSSLIDPLTYVRFFGHIIGHADWAHFYGNMTLFLITAPLLEERYGSVRLLLIIIATALITGMVHFTLFSFPLLGASGVVFCMILLTSAIWLKDGAIPLTLILVAIIFLGGQIYEGLFADDNVSQLTHIVGGLVGIAAGYIMTPKRRLADNVGLPKE